MAKMMMQTAYTDVEMEVNAGVARQLLLFAEGHPQTRVLSKTDGDGVDVAELRGLVTALRTENERILSQLVAVRRERDAMKQMVGALLEAIVYDQAAKVHPGSILREVTKTLRSYVNDGILVGYATGLNGSKIATQRRRRREAEQGPATTASLGSIIGQFERMTFTSAGWQRLFTEAYERVEASTQTYAMPRWSNHTRGVHG